MSSLENLAACPLCDGGHFSTYLETKDYSVTEEEFTIVSCNSCGFLFTNPRPVETELGKYYDSDEYVSHTNEGNSLINSLYKIARKFTLGNKLKLIKKHAVENKVLDYGCGTGAFLEYCQKHNWQIAGVEPNQQARSIANKLTNNCVADSLDQVKPEFDVITLWHVLEHVSKLNNTLKQIKSLLTPDGNLYIAVPNPSSKDAKKFERYWAAYDVPRHLYHFTQNSMNKLLSKHGMRIVEVLPMKLDSFYVSLLSNKYQFGSSKMINSFITGLLSNSYANKSGEYSSLIYRIQKND